MEEGHPTQPTGKVTQKQPTYTDKVVRSTTDAAVGKNHVEVLRISTILTVIKPNGPSTQANTEEQVSDCETQSRILLENCIKLHKMQGFHQS